MAKLTENQLYATWLDIWYAAELSKDFVSDQAMALKIYKVQARKNERMLKKATEHYQAATGNDPIAPKV